jgi:UDP:flavonoid glycosyltransferase YjiC (YdhE family)
VAFLEGLNGGARKRLEASNLVVAPRPVDMARASRECDLAVGNGGHSVTGEMLLAGKPLMLVPLVLEQQQTAQAVERLGAGRWAPARDSSAIVSKLHAMLDGTDTCAEAARRFARRYEAFDRGRQRQAMFERVRLLLAGRDRTANAPDARPHTLVD